MIEEPSLPSAGPMTTNIALSPLSAAEIDCALREVAPAIATPDQEVLRLVRWAIREARRRGSTDARVPDVV